MRKTILFFILCFFVPPLSFLSAGCGTSREKPPMPSELSRSQQHTAPTAQARALNKVEVLELELQQRIAENEKSNEVVDIHYKLFRIYSKKLHSLDQSITHADAMVSILQEISPSSPQLADAFYRCACLYKSKQEYGRTYDSLTQALVILEKEVNSVIKVEGEDYRPLYLDCLLMAARCHEYLHESESDTLSEITLSYLEKAKHIWRREESFEIAQIHNVHALVLKRIATTEQSKEEVLGLFKNAYSSLKSVSFLSSKQLKFAAIIYSNYASYAYKVKKYDDSLHALKDGFLPLLNRCQENKRYDSIIGNLLVVLCRYRVGKDVLDDLLRVEEAWKKFNARFSEQNSLFPDMQQYIKEMHEIISLEFPEIVHFELTDDGPEHEQNKQSCKEHEASESSSDSGDYCSNNADIGSYSRSTNDCEVGSEEQGSSITEPEDTRALAYECYQESAVSFENERYLQAYNMLVHAESLIATELLGEVVTLDENIECPIYTHCLCMIARCIPQLGYDSDSTVEAIGYWCDKACGMATAHFDYFDVARVQNTKAVLMEKYATSKRELIKVFECHREVEKALKSRRKEEKLTSSEKRCSITWYLDYARSAYAASMYHDVVRVVEGIICPFHKSRKTRGSFNCVLSVLLCGLSLHEVKKEQEGLEKIRLVLEGWHEVPDEEHPFRHERYFALLKKYVEFGRSIAGQLS